MKLKHKTPCSECPWRKDSLRGFLGGWPAEYYADAVQENEIPACHNMDFGPDDDRTAMCAGALSVASNSAIAPHKTPGASAAKEIVGKNKDCFSWVRDFYEYHTGKEYVPRILRMLSKNP